MAYDANAFQLTHLLQKSYRRLKGTKISIATSGSTTTIVDSKLPEYLADSNEDDILNGGTVIIIKDAGGAGAAPEGEFNRISDYEDSNGTITVPDALTAAVASGDRYMYISSTDFPLYDLIETVNDALVGLGRIPRVYSSLTTANAQTEYTLPVSLKGIDLHDIEIQRVLTDSNDNRYVSIEGWKITPADPGTAGLLTIPQFASGYTLRIGYPGLHPRVSAYSDYISEYIHPELATAAVRAYAWQWYNDQRGGGDDWSKAKEDRAWNQLDLAKAEYPIKLPPARIGGFPHWSAPDVGDEFYPIPLP